MEAYLMMKNLFSYLVNLFQYIVVIPLNKILSFTYSVFRFYSIKMLRVVKYVLVILLSFICVFASAVPNYYQILQVSENATQEEIKEASQRIIQESDNVERVNLSVLKELDLIITDTHKDSLQNFDNSSLLHHKRETAYNFVKSALLSGISEKIERLKQHIYNLERRESLDKEKFKTAQDMLNKIIQKWAEQGTVEKNTARILEEIQVEDKLAEILKTRTVPGIQELASRILSDFTNEQILEFNKFIEDTFRAIILPESERFRENLRKQLEDPENRVQYNEVEIERLRVFLSNKPELVTLNVFSEASNITDKDIESIQRSFNDGYLNSRTNAALIYLHGRIRTQIEDPIGKLKDQMRNIEEKEYLVHKGKLKSAQDMLKKIVQKWAEQGTVEENAKRILKGMQVEDKLAEMLKTRTVPGIQELASRILSDFTNEQILEFNKFIEDSFRAMYKEIEEAREILTDSVQRDKYDEELRRYGFTHTRSSAPPDIHLKEVRWFDVQLESVADPYRVLGITEYAQEKQIRKKYKSLTNKIIKELEKERKGKQSRGLSQEKIFELNRIYSAYRILSHPVWRRQYDSNLDRTIHIRGQRFVFVDQANQVNREFFKSLNGEIFDFSKNEKGERVLVRSVLFPPPEKQTFMERFMGASITMETVIKVSGEKLEFRIKNMIDIGGLEARETLMLTDQRRRSLEDVIKDLKNRIVQTRQIQDNRESLENLRTQINEKWNSLKTSTQNQARNAQDRIKNIFQRRASSTEAKRSSSTTHSFEPSSLTWEELDRMTRPNSENSGSSFSRMAKRLGPESVIFFAALGAFMFLKTGFDSVQYDGVQMDPEWGESLMAQVTSPLGLVSLACFIMTAGATNMLLEKWMNKHIRTKYNQSKVSNNARIAVQGDVTEEHRKAARQIDKRDSRFLRLIGVSRTAFTLSAGMMVSVAVHEFFTDPNYKECSKGIMDKEKRSFDFIEICDRMFIEWKAVFKALLATPTTIGLYYLSKNKLLKSPLERKIAKGILGIVAVMFVSNGFDDFGKFKDWGPELATMVAAGYSASFVTNGVRWGWGASEKKWNWREKMSQNMRKVLDSKMNSNRWSKIKSMAGKFKRFKFGWPSWLLTVSHLVGFFIFHDVYHPFALSWKNANLSDDIFDQQMQINSYTNRSLNPHYSEEQEFEFWEGDPAEDCALSNPQDMDILEILKETMWNSEREDCPGRYFSHQLNVHSNLLSTWRQNQTLQFSTLNQSWERNQAEARLGYEAVTNILFDESENTALLSSDGELHTGWTDIYYHNVRDNESYSDFYPDVSKIQGAIDKEIEVITQKITEKVLFENEDCQQANREKEICNFIENDGLENSEGGIRICESANELIDSCSAHISVEVIQAIGEIEKDYTYDEGVDESDSNDNEYLKGAFYKFKWAVRRIDQYINTQENKDQFLFNNSVLADPVGDRYLNFTSSLLQEGQLLGTLRGLFNAVDQRVDVSQYYSTRQIDQCKRDQNCDEVILRVRAVSAGVDLLNRIEDFISAGEGHETFLVFFSSEAKYSDLISEVKEVFQTRGENPQTYTSSSDFVVMNLGMRDGINNHRQNTENKTGMFDEVVPFVDSFPSLANTSMQYILYNVVCGDDLDHISLPLVESAKCSSQEDLEQLVEQLPSFENGGENFVEELTQPYTFRIPKLIKGEAPAGLCEKDYKEAFNTSLTVDGNKYKNLLEFVLDSRNIKEDAKKFWEEKVEKQYILLMGCFETQYKKIYNNHFVSTVHSEEVDRVVKPADLSSAPPLSASMALGYADFGSVSTLEEIKMPKGILQSMMNQADYLLSKLKDVHNYPQSFESVDCSNEQNKDGKICVRKRAVEDHTFEVVKKRFGVCSQINIDRDYSMQEKANISIECFREMILDLFEHIGGRIKSQQCLTDDIITSQGERMYTTPNNNDQKIWSWGKQFDYATIAIQHLIPNSVRVMEIMDKHGVDKQNCLQDNWCPLYELPFRDAATFLVIRHLSSVFDQLVYLHHQVSLFSSHIAVSEECNEDYLSNSNNSTLIKKSADVLLLSRTDELQ